MERDKIPSPARPKSYLAARYEDIVNVRIHDGAISFNGRLAPYKPVTVSLIRGETEGIKLEEAQRPSSVTFVEIQFGEAGRYVSLGCSLPQPFRMESGSAWKKGQDYSVPDLQDSIRRPLAKDVHLTEGYELNGLMMRPL